MAVEHGIDGIFVSTHAGRVSDAAMGAIEMLPQIVEATQGRAEVYVGFWHPAGQRRDQSLGPGRTRCGHRPAPVLGLGR